MEGKESHSVSKEYDDIASELHPFLRLAPIPQKTLEVEYLSSIQAQKSDNLLKFEQEMLENDAGFSDLVLKAEEKTMDKSVVRFLPGKEGVFKIDDRISLGKVGYGRDFIEANFYNSEILEIEEHPVLDRSILLYHNNNKNKILRGEHWIAMVHKGMIIDKIQVYIEHYSRALYKVKNDVYFVIKFATSPKENLGVWDYSLKINGHLGKISMDSFSIQFFELEFPYPRSYSISRNCLVWVYSNGRDYFIGKSTLQGRTIAKTPLLTRANMSAPTLFSSEKTIIIFLDYSIMNKNLNAEIIFLPISLEKIEKIVGIDQRAVPMYMNMNRNFNKLCGLFIEGGFIWKNEKAIYGKEIEFWAVVTEGQDLGKVLCRKYDYGHNGGYVGTIENKFRVCKITPSSKVTLLTPSLI